jgi:outer membrane scaffolding protein for murein synthesis (MipA/OmpV family)
LARAPRPKNTKKRCNISSIIDGNPVPQPGVFARYLGVLAILVSALFANVAFSQTPSPMQEWQYSGGIILQKLFQPDVPEWRTVLGVASEVQPIYDGAHAYRISGGPVINIQFKDLAFLTTGDGIGVNIFRGSHYQVGLAVAYDLGRKERDDRTNLNGMGDIGAAPVAKVFGSWVISKYFPMILRVDVRQFVGGAQGVVGDAGVYIPLPGSSKTFVMFAGPSITLADHHYLQVLYGVTPEQSAASGHPVYDAHAGTVGVGVGFSATKFITEHWLVNLDLALRQIRGSAAQSPLVEERTQRVGAMSVNYNW